MVGLVAVVAVLVGVLVYPPPKEAQAVAIRYVFLVSNLENNPPVLGATVQFSQETDQDIWSDWVDGEEDDFLLGEYKHTFASLNMRWRIRVLLPYHGDNPNGDTQIFAALDPSTFEWVVWSEAE